MTKDYYYDYLLVQYICHLNRAKEVFYTI